MATDWISMETPPEDGVRALGWVPYLGVREFIGCACRNRWEVYHVWLALDDKYSSDWEWGLIVEPTHWRPIGEEPTPYTGPVPITEYRTF